MTGLARYGEKLSAVVGLIAIGMLLVILNWFFHKTYWTGHLAGLHGKKQAMMATRGVAFAQLLALGTLGFTSVYREGFETVLFVQALVLATDVATVLTGVLIGIAATVLVGVRGLQPRAQAAAEEDAHADRRMVTWVLVVMVGTTVQIMQTVGWLPVSPIAGLRAAVLVGRVVRRLPDLGGRAAPARGVRLRDRQLPRRRGGAQAPPQPRVRAQVRARSAGARAVS